jgi:hypothetical protein
VVGQRSAQTTLKRTRSAVELQIGDAQRGVMPGRVVLGRRGEQHLGLERPVDAPLLLRVPGQRLVQSLA